MLEKKKLWVAVSNTDLTEGRGKPIIVGYSTNKATAKRVGKGRGVMGSDCRVKQKTFWVAPDNQVFKYVGELTQPTDDEIKLLQENEE